MITKISLVKVKFLVSLIIKTFLEKTMLIKAYTPKEENNMIDRKSPLANKWTIDQMRIPISIGCLINLLMFVYIFVAAIKTIEIGINASAISLL